jgi:uncharacterized protein (UPF0216 family)
MTKGRKTIDKEALTETISLRFTKQELEKISTIAKELDMPKTRLMRNLALSSLEEAKIFHKLGILKGVKRFQDFKERFLNPEKYQNISID